MSPDKKKRLRNLTLKDYGISEERYRELKYFCMQYPEKKKTAEGIRANYGMRAIVCNIIGSGSGSGRDPTEATAIRNVMKQEEAARDLYLMETAARWATAAASVGHMWSALLYSVGYDAGYDTILTRYNIPVGKTDFYAIRRAFFYKLDQLQLEERRARE